MTMFLKVHAGEGNLCFAFFSTARSLRPYFHLLSFFLPMAAKAEDAPPVSATTPIDPPDPSPDSEARCVLEEKRRIQRNEEAADSEARPRESKRRRTCPEALETAASSLARVDTAGEEEKEEEEGLSSGTVRGEFSFFFDAKGQSPIETTPKFGTFRFLEADRATEEAGADEERTGRK